MAALPGVFPPPSKNGMPHSPHGHEISRFIPCFIFGYRCAFLGTRLPVLTLPAAWKGVLPLGLET